MINPIHGQSDTSGQSHILAETAWISVQTAAEMFADAKMPRNSRTIRRYCMRGDLACQKTENALHQPQYFISKDSVETYIAQQRTLLAGRPDASGDSRIEPDLSGHDHGREGNKTYRDDTVDISGHAHADPDMPGTARTGPDNSASGQRMNSIKVEQLEARIADKDEEIAFLRGELLHRRTTDTALHDVIAAFRANAESQRLAAAPQQDTRPHSMRPWPPLPSSKHATPSQTDQVQQGTSDSSELV